MGATDHDSLAAELLAAASTATPVTLLTERHPDLTWDDARAIARATDRLRLAAGQAPIGYKLGWTSAQMREALGIDRPNWGTLFAHQLVAGPVDLAALIHPKVEPELVYRPEVGLEPGMAAGDIAATGGTWALGIEVVDPRFPSYDFDWLDNTADNSSSALIAVGPFASLAAAPATVAVTFEGQGQVRHGLGANAYGDPLAAVAWLVDSLAGEGLAVEAGQLVFTGGLTAPFDLGPGQSFELSAPGLDPVVLTVATATASGADRSS